MAFRPNQRSSRRPWFGHLCCTLIKSMFISAFPGWRVESNVFGTFEHVNLFCFHRIIQQLVNGIIAPTAMPNMAMGPWWVANDIFCIYIISQCMINHSWSLDSKLLSYRGVLHSNPMDYAWGANGLDAIITQVSSGLLLCFITTRNMKFYRALCSYCKQYQCI